MSKKNKILIIASVLLVAIVATTILVLCLVVFKPEDGKKVTVLSLGEKIYVQAEETNEDCSYRFKFKNGKRIN